MADIYINIFVFLLMNCIVAGSSINLLKLFFSYSLADRILIFALLFCLQVIITELALGISGILTLHNLIFLNLIILLFVLLFTDKHLPQRESALFREPGLLNNNAIVFALSCIIGFGLIKATVNLINPPFGWDSLNYHFTFPVEWLKNRNLLNPMVINCDPSPPYYPINGSLIFLWLILPFKNVFLADIGQLPFFILALVAVFSLARKIGIRRDYSFLAAALFALIPNFFKQLEIAYVDTIFCAFFLIGVNFLVLLSRQFNLKNLLLAAAALGLLLGTKTIAVPFSAVLAVLLLLILFSQKGHKGKILYLVLSGSVVILLGGFTYIRNFILTGNFLYPANFYLFGKNILKGVLDISYYKAHYLSWDHSLGKLLFHEGLGAQTIILSLPALFISIPLTLIKNKERTTLAFLYFLAIPFSLYFIYRFIIPLSASRYLYPALALGLVIAFYCLETLKINRKVIYTISVICIIASLSELARRAQVFYSLLATGAAFVAIIYLRRVKLGRKIKIISSWAIGLLFILLLGLAQNDYLEHEFRRYLKPLMAKPVFWPDAARAWEWLNGHTAGASRIAYVGRPVPFPLYGTKFKNEVYYVSVNRNKPQLHAYPQGHYRRKKDYITLHENLKEPGNYRENPDYGIWLDNLIQQHTDYLFIYSLHQTKDIVFPIEEGWARAHPQNFELIFSNDTIRIYKIIKSTYSYLNLGNLRFAMVDTERPGLSTPEMARFLAANV